MIHNLKKMFVLVELDEISSILYIYHWAEMCTVLLLRSVMRKHSTVQKLPFLVMQTQPCPLQ